MVRLTDQEVHQISSLLVQTWREGGARKKLEDSFRLADRHEAYAVQACLGKDPSDPALGWKIAATSAKGQAHIQVSGPIAGRLLASRRLDDGGICSLAGNNMGVAELEFAFTMDRTLAPRDAPYEISEVLDAVAAVHPSIEVPSSRFARFEEVGELQLIADNACAQDYLIGPAMTGWRELDLPAHEVVAHAGQNRRDGTGANALGDPRAALTWLANELSGLGLSLIAGQFVMTGTCIEPIPVGPGDRLVGDFGSLGELILNFTE